MSLSYITTFSSLLNSSQTNNIFYCICSDTFLTKRQIVVCPVTFRRKENTGMWTRILMSFSNFNDNQKDNPCTVSSYMEETVASDRAGMKHLTLKFQGPVGLGGMNKWWKNELPKEHRPKGWMCSSHVVIVCYCCWNRQEEEEEEEERGREGERERERECFTAFYIA